MPFERGDDPGRIRDRLPIQNEHRRLGLPGHPGESRDVQAGVERPPDVRNPFEVQRPAHFLVEVREREVPEDGQRHRR